MKLHFGSGPIFNLKNTMLPTPYRAVLSAAQQKIFAAIAQIRNSIPHSGETGDLVERVFRDQLREVLPEKVGISNGFVVDSEGKVSRQMDIILFDRQNTPRIFTSAGAQMFPVESTYACGEIKTEMNKKQLNDSFEKCLSYKRLHRKAYFESKSVFQQTYKLFGRDCNHWQSIFFCISAHSISMDSLISTYKEIVENRLLPIHERIDTIVALDATDNQNMLLNGMVESDSGNPQDKSINLLPSPGSSICTYRAKEPWSLFVMLLLYYMVQVPTEPVNMLFYGGNEPY